MAQWLAIDWDQDQLHLLAAHTGRKGAAAERAASWQLPEPLTAASAERIGRALREFLKSQKFPAVPALVSVGRDRVILKEVRFPAVPKHEEPALVRFQASKELTEPPESCIIDYAPLRDSEGTSERHVLAVAVRRDLIATFQALCRGAGLRLAALAPRPFGAGAALRRALGGGSAAASRTTAVLSLGRRWAELSLYRGERLALSRVLPTGDALAGEVRRSLAVFQAQYAEDGAAPPLLYLFGPTEALTAAPGSLPIPVEPVNPFDPDTAAGDALPRDGEAAAAFAGSLGLLEAYARQGQWAINLAEPKKERAPGTDPRTRQRYVLAGAAAVLVIALIGTLWLTLKWQRDAIGKLTAEKQEYEETLRAFGPERTDIDAVKDWDNGTVPWADELYELAARFPHEPGFRVNGLSAGLTTNSGSKKNGASKSTAVARIQVIGVAPRAKAGLIDKFRDALVPDKHLRANVKRIKGTGGMQEFQMEIDLSRQPAEAYKVRLTAPPAPATAPEDGEEGDE